MINTYIINNNPELWVVAEDGFIVRMNPTWRDRLESVFGMMRDRVERQTIENLTHRHNWQFTLLEKESL